MLLSLQIPVKPLPAHIYGRHGSEFRLKVVDLGFEGAAFDDLILFFFKLFGKPELVFFLLFQVPLVLIGQLGCSCLSRIFSQFLHFIPSTYYRRVLLNLWLKLILPLLWLPNNLLRLPINLKHSEFRLQSGRQFLADHKLGSVLRINHHHLVHIDALLRRAHLDDLVVVDSQDSKKGRQEGVRVYGFTGRLRLQELEQTQGKFLVFGSGFQHIEFTEDGLHLVKG